MSLATEVLMRASTNPLTTREVPVQDGQSVTFSAVNLGSDVISIDVLAYTEPGQTKQYGSIAELSTDNAAQRVVGPAIYRLSKAATTAQPIASVTTSS